MDRALVSHDFPKRRLDDSGPNELRADTVSRAPGDPNDHLVLPHVQQLDAARVFFEERIEDVIDDLLHRFAHPRSMRNCAPKRKQS